MTTSQILSTIPLFALSLLPLSAARASTDKAEPTPAALAGGSESPTSPRPQPGDVMVRPTVTVGFAESPYLGAAIRARLGATGRYRLSEEPGIPSTPNGLFVGGFVSESKAEHGWMDCRAHYFVASQPSLLALQIDAVAASVPIMEVRIFRNRPEVLELAREACLDKLAAEIADRMPAQP